MISSVGAAPLVALPSFANYQLAANTTSIQNCASDNLTIAALVCGNQQSSLVTINGDGSCPFNSNDTNCFFSPASVTITAGGSVTWHDIGNVYHNILSNATANGSLPSFSNSIGPGGSSSVQFLKTGIYNYYDSNHVWMKGTVIVTPATLPPAIITSFAATGSIGWNVAGLGQNDALLGVNHKISVYNTTTAQQVPVYNDVGLLQQYVILGTREESPTTLGLLQSLPFGLSFSGFYNGYGYGFGGYGNPIPYVYPGSFFNFQPVHTLWWVNGPLDNGSIVELLTGHASVTGSKTVQLGSSFGSQAAWSVYSAFTQSSNQTQPGSQNFFPFAYCPFGYYFGGPQPQPQCFISESAISVSLTSDYGQQSDLLLGLAANISTLSQTTTLYPSGSTIYTNNGFGFANGFLVSAPVSIVRTTSTRLVFTLGFSSTNLDLSRRMALQTSQSSSSTNTGGTGANSPSPVSNQPLNTPWVYFLAGAGTVALISGVLWTILRIRRKVTLPDPPVIPATTR
jgi:plastocyanin